MASITKRIAATGDARYDVRTRIGGRVVTRTLKRRKDAEAWAAVTEADKLRGVVVDPAAGAVTFSVFSKRWLVDRHDLRPRTAEDYGDLVRLYLDPAFGDVALGQITPSAVRQWYAELSGRVPGRAHKAYRLLRTILNTAVADERIARNPCVVRGAGQDESAEREIPTIAEVEALSTAMPDRFALLVLVAAWCGLRRGELLALRRCDVDLVHGSLRIERALTELRDGTLVFGPPKTAAGRRAVHYPPPLAGPVAAHLAAHVGADPEALVFTGAKGGPVRAKALYGAWNDARRSVGVRYRLHDLRHLGATLAAATGASTKEVMRRIGHASPQAALIYQHATDDRDAAIAAALADLSPLATVSPLRPRDGRAMGTGAEGGSQRP